MAADSACCIRVACRIRPLNSKEKSSGSQFVVKFPRETSVALGVSDSARIYDHHCYSLITNYRTKFLTLTVSSNQTPHK